MHPRSLHARTLAIVLVILPIAVSCASMNNKTKGAVIGAGTGAVAGGVIGKQSGHTATGAIIGAAVGGAAGAIIGHQMDQQAKELKQNIPGAHVKRVGEGIQVTFDSGLLFAVNSDDVRGAAQSNLDALAANLSKYKESELMIVGHTDATGSVNYNDGLSARRADAASGYLRSRGVTRHIETVGRGEYEPVATNDTEAGRQQNRRVEVAIYASEAMKKAAVREANAG
jgi:outer membrane protein OmpA-like peptidoglycan-associated protein